MCLTQKIEGVVVIKRENSKSDIQQNIEQYMFEQIKIMLKDSTLAGDIKVQVD